MHGDTLHGVGRDGTNLCGIRLHLHRFFTDTGIARASRQHGKFVEIRYGLIAVMTIRRLPEMDLASAQDITAQTA